MQRDGPCALSLMHNLFAHYSVDVQLMLPAAKDEAGMPLPGAA